MRVENLLRGMTIPGTIPESRKKNMTKHLNKDERSLFVVQNLLGEIIRLKKLNARNKGIGNSKIYTNDLHFDNLIFKQ